MEAVALAATGMLMDAGFWVIVSLLLAGLLREFIDTGAMRAVMRRSGAGGVIGALGLGAVLPICSCGVVPLAAGFHLAGVRTAAVLTFTAATPVINPAAVLLALAFLGPQLTAVYVLFGLTAPLAVGYLTERLAPAGGSAAGPSPHCCAAADCCGSAPAPLSVRLYRGLRWALWELGPTLAIYLGAGILLAAVLTASVPAEWFGRYLGASTSFAGLLLVALFGATIYVCAVAHIPVVAALLAAGAGPGAAIVFLVTGAATNLPELLALQRVLGRSTVLVYTGALVSLSIVTGWLVNLALSGYRPLLDPLDSLAWSDLAASVTPAVATLPALAGALLLTLLAAAGLVQRVRRRGTLQARRNADA